MFPRAMGGMSSCESEKERDEEEGKERGGAHVSRREDVERGKKRKTELLIKLGKECAPGTVVVQA